jgi:hypothetical protein
MDLYVWSLLLGVVGLGAMSFTGLIGSGHSSGHGHGHGHAHGGHGHASPGNGHAHSHAHGDGHSHGIASKSLWTITSPRYLFSLALGFGTAGELLRPVLSGPLLLIAAAAGAIVFERLVVSPLWNFTMRFASTPASTLESAVTDEATAVTAFDQNGQGIVSLEVDGQVVQILATLRSDDRVLPTRVRAGQRVRIEDVNVEKNSCTVSLI